MLEDLRGCRHELYGSYAIANASRRAYLADIEENLNSLSDGSTDAVTSASAPADVATTILTAFKIINKDTTWDSAHVALKDPSTIEAFAHLHFAHLSVDQYELINAIITNQDLSLSSLRAQSQIAYLIAKWLNALRNGYEIRRAMRIVVREEGRHHGEQRQHEGEEAGEMDHAGREEDPAVKAAEERVAELRSELENHQRFADNESRKLAEYRELASKSLAQLTKKDLGEVRNYRDPHKDVVATLAAVMIILKKDRKWDSAVKQMQNPDKFLETLTNYSPDSMSKKVNNQLNEYSRLDSSQISLQSKGAGYMCEWMLAVREAYETKKRVE